MFLKHPKPAIGGVANDIQETSKSHTQQVLTDNAHPTASFFLLLIASTLITTLGLLLNNSPVIIGGMIIAPLMWPLMHLSLGISTGKLQSVRTSLGLLLLSILVAGLVATVTTSLSPLKQIDTEIIARTSPTLLDMIVALAAGVVATLAITHPKISESLAGVAIATSLLPPLCVTGIALSLQDLELFSGSLLLFITNVASILFVSTLMFWWIGYKNRGKQLVLEAGLAVTALILLILGIPLFSLLKNQSFEVGAYHTSHKELAVSLKDISSEASIDTLSTNLSADGTTLTIAADVFLPADTTIRYDQQQAMSESLERALGKRVDLQLRLQPIISVVSSSDLETIQSKYVLERTLRTWLQTQEIQASLEEFSAKQSGSQWVVTAELAGDPSTTPPAADIFSLEQALQQAAKQPVSVSLQVSPRFQLPTTNFLERTVITLTNEFVSSLSNIAVKDLKVINSPTSPSSPLEIELLLQGPRSSFTQKEASKLDEMLETKLERPVVVKTQVIETFLLQSNESS